MVIRNMASNLSWFALPTELNYYRAQWLYPCNLPSHTHTHCIKLPMMASKYKLSECLTQPSYVLYETTHYNVNNFLLGYIFHQTYQCLFIHPLFTRDMARGGTKSMQETYSFRCFTKTSYTWSWMLLTHYFTGFPYHTPVSSA